VLTAALMTIIVLALIFDYTNGFHDAANAIASAISTRALTPRAALIIAAGANLGGALLSTELR
jgi:PiT family inorganic phosphate transporter